MNTTDDCQSCDPINTGSITFESMKLPLDSHVQIIFTGFFNGFNVEVRSLEEMAMLYHMGCFGKGSMSRSRPKTCNSKSPSIMRKRQFFKRNDWYEKYNNTSRKDPMDNDDIFKEIGLLTTEIGAANATETKRNVIDLVSSDENDSDQSEYMDGSNLILDSCHEPELVIIVPNSDSEGENYFENLKPQCCLNNIKLVEKLMLTLPEAFFLSYGLGCLQILDSENKHINTDQLWDIFQRTDKNFIIKYVVYHYFRSKGFIVKPGIKFGGDFLLYKEAPSLAHSDFIVVIKSDKDNTDWVSTLGHIRMATTTIKEIVVAEVSKPDEDLPNTPKILCNYNVREILLTRRNRFSINNDDD
ncbi:hypothetical protein ACJJTC_005858 [Scirpophaga incertulas]